MRRMYYLVYGKTLKANDLKKYIAKICKRRKWAHWHNLGSQAIQDVVERVDRAYKAYFDNKKKAHPTKKSLPKFKKREMYKRDNLGDVYLFVITQEECNEKEVSRQIKIIKSTIILFVAFPAMAVYALYEVINALAIEIDLVRIRAMTNCCRKFKTI